MSNENLFDMLCCYNVGELPIETTNKTAMMKKGILMETNFLFSWGLPMIERGNNSEFHWKPIGLLSFSEENSFFLLGEEITVWLLGLASFSVLIR